MMTEKNEQKTGAYHVPVLLKESVDGLACRAGGVYVDATFGGGGHSREILSRLDESAHLYGFDQDPDAEKNSLNEDARFTFVQSNFRYLKNWMRYYGVEAIDGALADLGVSSHHFDDEHRGFSFRFDAPLDMRMNYRGPFTAAEALNDYSVEELARVFSLYGELKMARKLAEAVVRAREKESFERVSQLVDAVRPCISPAREKKDLARVFQALRMEVNRELSALEDLLQAALDLLKPGGRLVVISYHSLEDRMVKNFMRSGNIEGKVEVDFYGNRLSPLKPVRNKVIVPDENEQRENPRSRSAKLRIAEKTASAEEEQHCNTEP